MDSDPRLEIKEKKKKSSYISQAFIIDDMNSLLWRDYYGTNSK